MSGQKNNEVDGNRLISDKSADTVKSKKCSSSISNAISLYSSIIVEAFNEMIKETDKPIMELRERGSEGVMAFGTDQTSFRDAMIVLSFVGMWLHANLRHKMYAMKMPEKKYQRNKGKPYEQRLMIVGCFDEVLLQRVSYYRMARNKFLLETDYFDEMQILSIEEEAEKAYELFIELTNEFARLGYEDHSK